MKTIVNKTFTDRTTNITYKKGDLIDFTLSRFSEINASLSNCLIKDEEEFVPKKRNRKPKTK
tara:strand:- start:549 stop:734 length:186 start_codon:yes stop_codon:yes gene_type:complete